MLWMGATVLCLLAALGESASGQAGPDGVAATAVDTAAALPIACGVTAGDVPDDGGGALHVTWELQGDTDAVSRFVILRYAAGEEPTEIGEALLTEREYVDSDVEDGTPYHYVIRTVAPAGSTDSDPSESTVAVAQWFSRSRLNILVAAALFCAVVLYFVGKAKSGADLYIRKIPGLDAVDDAVGRATEMGRPVLFIPGIETVSEVGTLAALTILGHVAKRVAQHGTRLDVPVADPIVMTTAQEITKAAYTEVGKLDDYDPSRISYLTYDQFGYTAGVDGMMVRDRPEAVFLIGTFYAESLIMAETGHAIGAIQIAGTKETSQLPFFVAACDYTLIGEEIFAASSYLSREPIMLGSLKGQDLAKFWIVCLMVAAVLVGSIGNAIDPGGGSFLTKAFEFVGSWFN